MGLATGAGRRYLPSLVIPKIRRDCPEARRVPSKVCVPEVRLRFRNSVVFSESDKTVGWYRQPLDQKTRATCASGALADLGNVPRRRAIQRRSFSCTDPHRDQVRSRLTPMRPRRARSRVSRASETRPAKDSVSEPGSGTVPGKTPEDE